MKQWFWLIATPPIFCTVLFVWLKFGLPTPLWMADFRENNLIAFAPLGMLGPGYYLALIFIYRLRRQGNADHEYMKANMRLAEPHEEERENIFQMLISNTFRHWFMWMSIISTGLILLGSIMYFEGINRGVTYFNQTYEQTGGWGIHYIVLFSIPISFSLAFLIANKARNLPQYVPNDAPPKDDDYRSSENFEETKSKPDVGSISTEKEALEMLGMSKPFTEAELKKRRTEILKKVHPDQGGSNMMARLVNEAYDLLKTKV